MSLTRNDVTKWAAGFFLSQNLPENWHKMPENDLLVFVEQNAWEPFEGWAGVDIWEEVVSLADSAIQELELPMVMDNGLSGGLFK